MLPHSGSKRRPRFERKLVPTALLCLLSALPLYCAALTSTVPAASPVRGTEDGTRWNELSPAQKSGLKPLEREWPRLDAPRKRKWLDIAARLPRMSPEERGRIQTRMVEWAAMTPVQRAQARQQFKEAEQAVPKGRQAQWDAYQALSDEQKRQFAGRAERAAAPDVAPARSFDRASRAERAGADEKSNIVPNPALAARPRPVAPVVVQAAPGATTTLLSKRATPPAHQQAGLPKIAGSSNFIDPSTLLPQRGPQGAAITAAAASTPLPRP